MTLIAALKGKDGFVLASDSRGTVGDPRGLTAVRDVEKKIFKLSNHVWVGISGATEIGAELIKLIQQKVIESKREYMTDILAEMRQTIKNNYNEWFKAFELGKRPVVCFLTAGYDNPKVKTDFKEDDMKIYALLSNFDFAPQLCTSGHMLSGVVYYGVYLLHRFYNPNMKVNNLKRLAAYVIGETATQDPKVGGPIQMATISPAYFIFLSEKDVAEVIKENEKQSEQLKGFFFKEE